MSQLRRLLGIVVTLAMATGTLILSGAGTASAAPGYNANLTRYPYLTDLVGTKVTVNWATTRVLGPSSTGAVTWGPAGSGCNGHLAGASKTLLSIGPSDASPTAASAEYQWQSTIDLGTPGQYCYRVWLSDTKNPATPGNPIDLLGTDASPSFRTQVPAGSTESYSFAVFGDWGSVDQNGANPDEANVMHQIANSGARFAISTGDNAYNNGSQEDYGDLNAKFKPGDPSAVPPVAQVGMSAVFGPSFWTVPGSSVPIFPAIGNHGFARNDSACVSPPDVTKCHPHIQNWPQPTAVATSSGRYTVDAYGPTTYGTAASNLPSLWYAFDAGVARFYVLETAWPDSNVGSAPQPGGYANDYETHWKPGTPEYDWLKADLAAHPGTMKFAIFHKPLNADTSSKNEASDTWLRSDGPAGNQSLEALLATNGVAMAFNGHAHIYQRNAARIGSGPSLVSYVTGGGGAPPESLTGSTLHCTAEDKYAIAWSPTTNTGSSCNGAPAPTDAAHFFHFLKVTVNGTTVTVEPTNSLGQVFDPMTYDVGAAASAGYTVDGYGGLHPFSVGGAPQLAAPVGAPYWGASGFDIARGVALTPDHKGGYVVDGWGGLHPFAVGPNGVAPQPANGGPYWKGWDIAKGVVINPDSKGGFVLDGWGGLHGFAIGNNPVPTKPADAPYWNGFNIARGAALLPNGGGYTVDGWGGVHPFTINGATAPSIGAVSYWKGWDIVRGIAVTSDGTAGYNIDGYGVPHGFVISKIPPAASITGYWPGRDIVRGGTL